MDYAAVYDRFIADRRALKIEAPVERHHVVPRALGGSNKPGNLISLTLQDHLFAHLLLAKIHGGPMAVALINMLQFKRYQGRRSRLQYATLKTAARRYLSDAQTGKVVSQDARVKMSASQKERCVDPEARKARDAALYSPQAVAKAKAGGKAYWDNPERREAMRGNTHSTGRVLSDLHKQRIAAATTAHHARRRAQQENNNGN